ncbi:MAG: sulfite exporter TauE/SafE family protein [Gammaproteobacteria bacterium]
MFDLSSVIVIAATFLLAGAVKGVIGLGLPTLSLGLLAATLDLTTAMALLIIPSFMTNLWQAIAGGKALELLRRLWPFLLMATLTVLAGATALTRLDLALLSILLGGLLVCYSLLSLVGFHMSISSQAEPWAGPVFGTVNGILTGMTGSFVVPGVMYLQSIGLPRDTLVQAMGILFTASTLALAFALHTNNLLTPELGLVSAMAVVPAAVGMVAGQRIRRKLPEARFRQIFFIGILLLGVYIILQTLL